MQFVATKKGRPLAIVEAPDWTTARTCDVEEVRAADSISAVAAFADHGLRLREGFKRQALDKGHDANYAERVAEGSGFQSALDGLPVYVRDDQGRWGTSDTRVTLTEAFRRHFEAQGCTPGDAERRAEIAARGRS